MKILRLIGNFLIIWGSIDYVLFNWAGIDVYSNVGIHLTGFAFEYSPAIAGVLGVVIMGLSITLESKQDVQKNEGDILFTCPIQEKRTVAEFDRRLVVTPGALKVYKNGESLMEWEVSDIFRVKVSFFGKVTIVDKRRRQTQFIMGGFQRRKLKRILKNMGIFYS